MNLEESKVMFLPLNDVPDKIIAGLNSKQNIVAYELQSCQGSCGWIIYVIQVNKERGEIPEPLKNMIVPAMEKGFDVFYLGKKVGEAKKREGRMLTLSTGHISSLTAQYLDMAKDPPTFPVFKKGGYGWFINLYDIVRMTNLRTPSDLGCVLRFATSKGYDLLCLDHDGERVEALPFFDW